MAEDTQEISVEETDALLQAVEPEVKPEVKSKRKPAKAVAKVPEPEPEQDPEVNDAKSYKTRAGILRTDN